MQVNRASRVVKGDASDGQFGQLYWRAKKKMRSVLLDTGRNDSCSKPNLGKGPESSLVECGAQQTGIYKLYKITGYNINI